MGSDMIRKQAIEIRKTKLVSKGNGEAKLFEQERCIMILKDEIVREGLRMRAEVEKLRGEIDDIRTACVNELQRIAESRKPFKIVLGDDDEKR